MKVKVLFKHITNNETLTQIVDIPSFVKEDHTLEYINFLDLKPCMKAVKYEYQLDACTVPDITIEKIKEKYNTFYEYLAKYNLELVCVTDKHQLAFIPKMGKITELLDCGYKWADILVNPIETICVVNSTDDFETNSFPF